MFENYYEKTDFYISKAKSYNPLPPVKDRVAWEGIPAEIKQCLVKDGERLSGFDWAPVLACDYMNFRRTGRRDGAEEKKENKKREAITAFLLAECVENKGRFLDDIINGVWAFCDEATWVIPAHNYMYPVWGEDAFPLPDTTEKQKVFIDILGSDIAVLMALSYYLFKEQFDEITPVINRRLLLNLQERIITPFLSNEDYPWMGQGNGHRYINNWTVWISCNLLSVTALALEDKKQQACIINKVLPLVDKFLASIPEDGSYPEGTHYWTVAAGCLTTIHTLYNGMTAQNIPLLQEEKIQNLMEYIVKTHITKNQFVNIGDAERFLTMQPISVYSIAKTSGNDRLKQFACALRENGNEINYFTISLRPLMGFREFMDMAEFQEEPQKEYPYLQSVWFPGVELMCERLNEAETGMYLAVKAGTNYGSHSHLDTGSFMIYSDGQPAVIDLGKGEYSKKMFAALGHEVVASCSENHSTPFICGMGQRCKISISREEMEKRRAQGTVYKKTGNTTVLETELKNVYPSECSVSSWKRKFCFEHSEKKIVITDDFQLGEDAKNTCSGIICASKPYEENGYFVIPIENGRNLKVVYSKNLRPVIEEINLSMEKILQPVWGNQVWRLCFYVEPHTRKGTIDIVFSQMEN